MLKVFTDPAVIIFIPLLIGFTLHIAIRTLRALFAKEILEYKRYF